MNALAQARALASSRLPDLCLLTLRLAGWATVTVLATLGCFVVFFLMLGNFSAEGFFAHLANLSSRFTSADVARQSQFLNLSATVSAVLFAGVAISRRSSLLSALRLTPKGPDHA